MSTHTQPALYTGMQETFSKVLTEGEAALFAGLVGDNRPQVFTSGVDVESTTTRLTVHPLFLVGIIGGLLNTRIPGDGSQCVTMQYEFLAPVFCGDRIETVIVLTEFDPSKHLATFRTDCYNQGNNQVITGQAVMLVAS
jgi:3-hydroxybutyryl-CoA dehydratase